VECRGSLWCRLNRCCINTCARVQAKLGAESCCRSNRHDVGCICVLSVISFPPSILQGIVGQLVAKTLSTASSTAYYNARVAPPTVAFDVFSVQAGSGFVWVAACAGL
jgi:hypothetical protein